jgi:hypothetical protein
VRQARLSAPAAAAAIAFAALSSSRPATAQSPPRAPASLAIGDATLTPVIDVRVRGEARDDPPDMGGGDAASGVVGARVRGAFAVLERARLGATVDSGAVRGRVVLEDARVWGTAASDAVFGPYEAFVEAHTAAARPSWLRVGRQSVAWGEGLLIGAAEFAPVGRSLDAVRGRWSVGALEIEGLAALLAAPQPQTPALGTSGGPWTSGTELYGLHVAWPIDPLIAIELTALARVSRSGEGGGDLALARGDGEIYTGSVRAAGPARGFAPAAAGAAELGRAARSGAGDVPRRAWAAFVHADETFETAPLTPSVRLGASYASGDDAAGGAYTAFDPLLPDVHVHFGAMNAFAWSNTVQAHLRGGVVPFADATLSVEYRYARLAQADGEWVNGNLQAIGRATGASADLGHELDVLFSYAPWPALELRAGYAGVLWGDGARTILAAEGRGRFDAATGTYAPSDFAHYGYLQARLVLP